MVYQLGVLPSGAIAPALSIWLVSVFDSSWPVAVYVMAAAVIALIALRFAKETAHDDIDVDLRRRASAQRAGAAAPTSTQDGPVA